MTTAATTRFTVSLLTCLGLATPALAKDFADRKPAETSSRDPLRKDQPWIKRWAPERNMHELGAMGGVLVINGQHELFQPNPALPDQGHRPLAPAAPAIGARYGYYPAPAFGIELEGSLMPTRVQGLDAQATLFTGRGQLVLQLPTASVVPFAAAGAGIIGVRSDLLGRDVDPELHFGGGLKMNVNRYTQVRLDVRDVLTYERGVGDRLGANNLEVTVGLSMTLGRSRPKPAPQRKDTDKDGYYDDEDMCPLDPETFNGFRDEDGCPESDRDGDGLWDQPAEDECPDEPETKNGFEDYDGCPDEIPDEVEQFMGVIEGIHFEFDRDRILPDSEVVLSQAVAILNKYQSIGIRIHGHTDIQGDAAYNVDLSQRRAEAVKRHLVAHGIADTRISTQGHGSYEPIADNASPDGRALNRRIEFEVSQDADGQETRRR